MRETSNPIYLYNSFAVRRKSVFRNDFRLNLRDDRKYNLHLNLQKIFL